jgi:hypothetical protein
MSDGYGCETSQLARDGSHCPLGEIDKLLLLSQHEAMDRAPVDSSPKEPRQGDKKMLRIPSRDDAAASL